MSMKIRCVWEHNGGDSMLYAVDFIGAFTRGASRDAAMQKMPAEISAYLKWKGNCTPGPFEPEIVQEKSSSLTVSDADSDVIFEDEKRALDMSEYLEAKAIVLKSAQDFLALYQAMPEKDKSCLEARATFYGQVPRTASEMYEHTKNVNDYYFGELGVSAGNEGDIAACRERGFELLERRSGFLSNTVYVGSYGEEWSLRKVLRRFVWHDRIHAKAMYRMARKTFGPDAVPNIFCFEL